MKNTATNSSYTQVGVQCFYESEVLNQSSVLLMKFSAKNPHLRVAAKRCVKPYPLSFSMTRLSILFKLVFKLNFDLASVDLKFLDNFRPFGQLQNSTKG